MAVLSPSDEPWMRLAIAVVERAVEDYRIALYEERFCNVPTKNVEAMENWFKSEHGQLMCLGQGEHIMRKVKEEVRLGKYYRPLK